MDRTHELRVEPNVLRACQAWANAAEGGWSRRVPGIAAFGCAAGYRSFNQVFVIGDHIEPAALAEAISWYGPAGGHFRLRTRGELLEGVRETLEAAGLVRQGGLPTMTFAGVAAPPAPSSLRIERVSDAATLHDHTRVVAESFEWTTGDLARVFGRPLLRNEVWAGWVGYEGERPVASSQLLVHGGVGGLYYVGTVKEARGRGYGEALTRTAIAEGCAQGCEEGVHQEGCCRARCCRPRCPYPCREG